MADPSEPAAEPTDATVRRLERDLADVREQFAATSGILTALGRAGADPSAILDTIVERAASLCGADASVLYLLEDGIFHISRVSGSGMEEYVRYWAEHPSTMSIGRASRRRAGRPGPHDPADRGRARDPEYGRQDLQAVAGFRTLLSAPMIVDDEVVGVLAVWRTTVSPFDERAIELLGVVRRAGRDRRRERGAGAGPRVPQRRAGHQGRPARGAARGRRGGQLEPRPRRGPAAIVATRYASPAPTAARSWSTTSTADSFQVRAPTAAARSCSSGCAGSRIRRDASLVGRAAAGAPAR